MERRIEPLGTYSLAAVDRTSSRASSRPRMPVQPTRVISTSPSRSTAAALPRSARASRPAGRRRQARSRSRRPGRRPQVALDQLERILSLDIDGRGYEAVGDRDPVIGGLQARYPGLRPVLFHSAYEAAAWTIIGARIAIRQAARVKAAMAEALGDAVEIHGEIAPRLPRAGPPGDARRRSGACSAASPSTCAGCGEAGDARRARHRRCCARSPRRGARTTPAARRASGRSGPSSCSCAPSARPIERPSRSRACRGRSPWPTVATSRIATSSRPSPRAGGRSGRGSRCSSARISRRRPTRSATADRQPSR